MGLILKSLIHMKGLMGSADFPKRLLVLLMLASLIFQRVVMRNWCKLLPQLDLLLLPSMPLNPSWCTLKVSTMKLIVRLNSIMASSWLATDLKMDMTSGLSRTPGEPNGAMKAMSKWQEEVRTFVVFHPRLHIPLCEVGTTNLHFYSFNGFLLYSIKIHFFWKVLCICKQHKSCWKIKT